VFRKIIVGYDGGEGSEDALALGRAIATACGADLVVTGIFPRRMSGDEPSDAEFTRRVDAAAELIHAEARPLPSSSPARGLDEAAEDLGADLIVVGSPHKTGHGLGPAGNVGLNVMHGAPCAVAVAPAGLRETDVGLRVIAAAVDGSSEAEEALDAAIEVGGAADATLRLLTVVASPASAFGWGYGVYDIQDQLRESFREVLDKAVARVPTELRPSMDLLDGDPAAALIEECGKGVDLLCMGSRGYGPMRRLLLGSVSGQLVKGAPCAVLAVPRGSDRAASDAQRPPGG